MSKKILTNGFNNLYNQIFCNLFTTNNGFNTYQNSNFGNEMSTWNGSYTTQNNEQACLKSCDSNNWCTSYSYNTLNDRNNCTLYSSFPTDIHENVNGINSGYSLKFGYDYNQLNNSQKNNIQKKCANQFLNNTFTKNAKNIDLSSCIQINNNNQVSQLILDPKCVYDIYNQNNIPTQQKDFSTYLDNNGHMNGKNDPLIDQYIPTYYKYHKNKKIISSETTNKEDELIDKNIDNLYNKYITSLDEKKEIINNPSIDIINEIGIENFDNNKNTNIYKGISFLIILIIISIIIFFLFRK